MNFSFSADQLLFRDSVRDFLSNEVTPENIRERWETESGRSEDLWTKLVELGLSGMLASEDNGGLGMNEEDFILIAEECGRAALPEPLVENAMIIVPLLQAINSEKTHAVLEKVISGESRVAIGHSINPLVSDAHFADYLLLQNENEIHLLGSEQVELEAQESVDPSRKLFKVNWKPASDTCIESNGEELWQKTLNRGALAVAAQHLGLAQQIVAMCVEYTSERKQFGQPIGSFQAVKHHMANIAVKYEFSKAVIYRAANSIASNHPDVDAHVSHAKIAASDAALLAAKHGIQVHGAMGYTWEVNLHIWMKRIWATDNSWGGVGFHKKRVANKAFTNSDKLGAGFCF